MTTERIQKSLANAGVGSRRQIERMIQEGRIVVNGELVQLGQKVSPTDRIMVDGKRVMLDDDVPVRQVLAYHKPVGEITGQRDPHGRPSVFDNLPNPASGRWIVVGRLDINTCGLLLFTTDGNLANKLMHPSNQLQREYAVRVLGKVTEDTLKQLTKGVELEDGMARFKGIKEGGGEGANRWFRVVLTEGRQREVRRMWEAVDCKVSRLIRVRFGNIDLEKSLRPGKTRLLTDGEMTRLYTLAGLTRSDAHTTDDEPKKRDPNKKRESGKKHDPEKKRSRRQFRR